MNLCEWKEKQSQKIPPQYTHFDRRVSLDRCFGYITSHDKIAHHGFYPFIHYTIKSRKVKDGKKDEPKKRQIYYAAHIWNLRIQKQRYFILIICLSKIARIFLSAMGLTVKILSNF